MTQADQEAILEIPFADLPARLRNIPGPPQSLFIRAAKDTLFAKLMRHKRVAIVGSRKVTAYGQLVTERFAGELAAQGIVIVSGLALGVDAIAHRATLEAEGLTMAVLPTPIDNIQPRTNAGLAQQILTSNGVLVSEYPPGSTVFKTNFVARNRIVTGLVDALLITEATEDSGTLHTARFALEQGIDVLAVPGNIYSSLSAGTNNLIKTGATPVTDTTDVLFALGHTTAAEAGPTKFRIKGVNQDEQQIIDLIEQGMVEGNELLAASGMSVEQFNHHLTMLEITTKIRSLGANRWALH